jgi:hypothetical protein
MPVAVSRNPRAGFEFLTNDRLRAVRDRDRLYGRDARHLRLGWGLHLKGALPFVRDHTSGYEIRGLMAAPIRDLGLAPLPAPAPDPEKPIKGRSDGA